MSKTPDFSKLLQSVASGIENIDSLRDLRLGIDISPM
jgi:hypothetical protein